MPTPPTQPLRQFVRAGAGAGKTTNLTRQVIDRALEFKNHQDQWPKTVVTTFTRKATQELKERLLQYCISERPEALDFVHSSNFLLITTMHGLFDNFLRRYGSQMGLPGQFQIMERQQALLMRKKILRQLVKDNPQFGELLVHFDFRRLLKFLSQFEEHYWSGRGAPAHFDDVHQLALWQSQNVCEDLQELLSEAGPYAQGEKWQAYFSYLSDLLSALEQSSWQRIRDDLSKVIGRVIKPRKSKKNPGLPEPLDEKLSEIRDVIKSFAADPEYDPEIWRKNQSLYQSFFELAKNYFANLYKEKVSEALLEPNDLEFFSQRLMQDSPHCLDQFHGDWDQWFIDEFQDTSPKQLSMLESIIQDKACYIVGDPQQSIYLFRGSRSEVFVEKQKAMEKAGDKLAQLQTNYRSRKPLLDFFNDFFPKISTSFTSMEAHVQSSDSSEPVKLTQNISDDLNVEIENIATQISGLLEQGASPQEIAILGRTNESLERIQQLLIAKGFPAISHSSSRFFARREIIDSMALLKLLLNPWDDANLVTLMRSPWLALSDIKIIEIIGELKSHYWKNFKIYIEDNPNYEPGQLLQKAMEEKENWGVAWVFRKLLIQYGLFDRSSQIDNTGRREANLWKLVNLVEKLSREPGANLLQLAQEGGFAGSLDEFGDDIDASSPVEPNKINLMTIHASKGLQFKHVFIPFLHKKPKLTTHDDFSKYEDKWAFRTPFGPKGKSIGSPIEKAYVAEMKRRELDESLRVLYVGMTRAEHNLYLSWTGQPEKNSWAKLVEKSMDQNELKNAIFQRIEEAQAQEYKSTKEKVNTLSRFTSSKNRFYLKPQQVTQETRGSKSIDEQDFFSSQKKRRQGVILHRLFEELKNHSREKVKTLCQLWLSGDSQSVEKALQYIAELKEPPLMEFIQQGEVEWSFQRIANGQIQEGRIDLWSIHENQLWILDYKTGTSKNIDLAWDQLRAYQAALCDYLDWPKEKPVKLCVIYPFEEKVFLQ